MELSEEQLKNARVRLLSACTQFLDDNRSLYCICGHSYHIHRPNPVGTWYDAIYGKPVVPACTECFCEKFKPYRYRSQEVLP